jgi:hypothetical protein
MIKRITETELHDRFDDVFEDIENNKTHYIITDDSGKDIVAIIPYSEYNVFDHQNEK